MTYSQRKSNSGIFVEQRFLLSQGRSGVDPPRPWFRRIPQRRDGGSVAGRVWQR
jgi:hypothetical protein